MILADRSTRLGASVDRYSFTAVDLHHLLLAGIPAHRHFKCNLRHVYEYPALWGYTRELHQMTGIAETIAIDEYKTHYYGSHRQINPTGIVPVGPVLDLTAPHRREA